MMNRLAFVLLLGVVGALLHTQIYLSPWGEHIEQRSMDAWFSLRGEIDPPKELLIVAMDEDSYEELNLPMDRAWPRRLHARLLERLAAAGARKVLFDILFMDASADPAADEELAAALKLVPAVIGAEVGRSVGTAAVERLYLPWDKFAESAAGLALVGYPEDAGMVRRFQTERSGRARDFPTIAEAAADIKPGGPGRPDQRDYIAYYGPAGTIPTVSYYQALDPQVIPDQELKDKVVLVGLMLRTELGPAQKDSFLTPFWHKGRLFGVEIHANAAGNLLEGRWIQRAKPWQEALVLGVLAFLFVSLMFLLRPQWAGLAVVVFFIGWAAAAFSAFLNGWFLPGVLLCIYVLLPAYLLSTLYYYFVSSQAQRQTQRAFEMYISPEMARQVAKDPKALTRGGETIYATAMFTDIVDFTPLSERMLADDVTKMLNAYFSEVMGVIFENRGTLIKFIGDSVFAIWGAPVKSADHAEQAVRSALMIQRAAQQFNASGRFQPLDTRIGINTGPMVVGNLGSDRRVDYTAIGDAVNLASRLEGLNRYFGTPILISDETRKGLMGELKTYRMGTVSVKGKSDAVGVHAVFPAPLSPLGEEKWLLAIAEFGARKWERAETLFNEAKVLEERLGPAADLYLAQIAVLSRTELGPEWHGAISFATK